MGDFSGLLERSQSLAGDLVNRSLDLKVHYTDYGAFPRTLALSYFYEEDWISIHMISGAIWVQAVIFLLHGAIACFLIFGFYTKTATVLLWLFCNSLQARNPPVLHGIFTLQATAATHLHFRRRYFAS